MEVHVVGAGGGLRREPRGVEVVDVAHLRVEDVEEVDVEADARVEAEADARADETRRLGTDAVVFNERTWAEVAVAQLARDPAQVENAEADRGDAFDSTRNPIAERVVVA